MTTTDSMNAALWCDTFDADLLAVVPGAIAALGPAANLELWTYSNPTNGRINCPAAWHTDFGLAAFFSTRDRSPTPAHSWTRDPLVECTFLEVVRDEWVHSQVVIVNNRVVWTPPADLMQDLMYDLRGWSPLHDDDRAERQSEVRRQLTKAAVLAMQAAAS